MNKHSVFVIEMNDKLHFELTVDGEYYGAYAWVFEILEIIGRAVNVNLNGCFSETEQLNRLLLSSINVEIKE